jgi:hypothetical protein
LFFSFDTPFLFFSSLVLSTFSFLLSDFSTTVVLKAFSIFAALQSIMIIPRAFTFTFSFTFFPSYCDYICIWGGLGVCDHARVLRGTVRLVRRRRPSAYFQTQLPAPTKNKKSPIGGGVLHGNRTGVEVG